MTTITTRNDLRDHLDALCPFLREEGRLEEATSALWFHSDAPTGDEDGEDPWGEFLDEQLGDDGNGIYTLIG